MNKYQRAVLIIAVIIWVFSFLSIDRYQWNQRATSLLIRNAIAICVPLGLLYFALSGDVQWPVTLLRFLRPSKQAESVKQVHNQRDLVIALIVLIIALIAIGSALCRTPKVGKVPPPPPGYSLDKPIPNPFISFTPKPKDAWDTALEMDKITPSAKTQGR